MRTVEDALGAFKQLAADFRMAVLLDRFKEIGSQSEWDNADACSVPGCDVCGSSTVNNPLSSDHFTLAPTAQHVIHRGGH